MTDDAWWVKINGEVIGPKKSAELRQLARTGVLHVHSSVSRDGINWVNAGRVRGLFPLPAVPGPGMSAPSEPANPFQVFISYSTKDKTWADTACASIEQQRIPCWIAPRDIVPGAEWGKAIIDGIDESQLMVLIFSENANDSPQVRREVERAISKGLPLIPFRIEDVAPAGAMEFALSNTHWLDGFTKPVEHQYAKLVRSIQALQGKSHPKIELKTSQSTTQRALTKKKRWSWMPIAGVAGSFLGLLLMFAAWPKNGSKDPLIAGQPSSGTQKEAKGSAQNAPSAGFVSIFNGKDLTGWLVDSGDQSNWVATDGLITANSPGVSRRNSILTDRYYGDYILRFDYLIHSNAPAKTNWKLIVRGVVGEKTRLPGLFKASYIPLDYPHIRLAHPNYPTNSTGNFSGLSSYLKNSFSFEDINQLKSSSLLNAAIDQWNHVEFTVRGKTCSFKVNDGVALEYMLDPIAEKQPGSFPGLKRSKGRIGFGIYEGSFQLRNIIIKDLSGSSGMTPSASQDERTTDVVQPIISTFSPNNNLGWATANEDGSKNATKKIEVRTNPQLTWLHAEDDNPTKSWGWVAPDEYCGNQSTKFALYFRFMIYPMKVNFGKSDEDPICIRIRGGGRSLVVCASDLENFSPEVWHAINVNLSGNGPWRTQFGAKATDDDLKAVLRDVKEIWIRGEYYTSPGGCALKGIIFGSYFRWH